MAALGEERPFRREPETGNSRIRPEADSMSRKSFESPCGGAQGLPESWKTTRSALAGLPPSEVLLDCGPATPAIEDLVAS